MHYKSIFFLGLLIFLTTSLFAQKNKKTLPPEKEHYKLEYDPSKPSKSCIKCLQVLSSMPNGVSFGLIRQGNIVFFGMTDKDWYDQIFDSRDDGIAVDVIQKNQFECGKVTKYDKNDFVKGTLLKPVFLKNLKKTTISLPGMDVLIPVAEIPQELAGSEDLEFNLLIIKNDNVCHYMRFFDIKQSKLDLLKMEIFMDTMSVSSADGKDKSMTLNRKLEFVIPFEKNKSEYKPNDLKPVYDSLHLNFYNIKSIQLRAFSSVEGLESRNIELQKKRAESIISSLQTFQNLQIQNDVNASENWVEFLQDISESKYATLKLLSKEEIKKELEKKNVSDDLEIILKKHRKAVLFIELEKKSNYRDLSATDAKKYFNEAIEKKNLSIAYEIQQAIFQNIDSKKYQPGLIGELEVPEAKEYSSFLVNNLVFNLETKNTNLYTVYNDFQRLESLDPKNTFIKYNISVIQLKLLLENELIVTRNQILAGISKLPAIGIDLRLVRRLQINYNIIMADYLYMEKKYAERDKCINFIFQNYKSANYRDEDLVRLSQYFVAYRRYDWALKCIEERANKIDVSEDLLFYFINLTINDSKRTQKEAYRSALFNAYNLNPSRFCGLFNTAYHGGISFQLLEDKYLKKNFCESCSKNPRIMKL